MLDVTHSSSNHLAGVFLKAPTLFYTVSVDGLPEGPVTNHLECQVTYSQVLGEFQV